MAKHKSQFIDVQDKEGLHFWVGVDQWDDSGGGSRRLSYERLDTWNQCRQHQLDHGVEDRNAGVDIGHRFREALRHCNEWHWIGYKGDDAEKFPHFFQPKRGGKHITIYKPWSESQYQDPMSGRSVDTSIAGMKFGIERNRKSFPWAITRQWSNPSIYPIFYGLKNGTSGRYYGIASDMPKDYRTQLNSHIPKWEDGKVVWIKTNPDDHAWDVGCGNLTIAMIRGWHSIDVEEKKDDQTEEP